MTGKKTLSQTTIIISISITILVTSIYFLSDEIKFAEAGVIGGPPPPPSTICPEDGTVQHWDKVIFVITNDPSEKIPQNSIGKKLIIIINDKANEIISLDDKIKGEIGQKWDLVPSDLRLLEIDIVDVKYQTVTCGVQGDTGPQGPKGDKGDKGDPGPTSEQDIVTRQISKEESDSSKTKNLVVTCGADEKVTGGGYGASPNMQVIYNGPNPIDSDSPSGWRVVAVKENGPTGTLAVNAICAKLVP